MSGAKKKLARRAVQAQMGLTEREKQELRKQQEQKRNQILATVGGIIAVVLVVALLVWNSGFIDRHTTALKFTADDGTGSDLTLTQADMDYFYQQAVNSVYSQEQSMASMYAQLGMEYTPSFDPTGDLKTQYVDADQTMSYDDYCKQIALENAKQIVALSNTAKAEGYTLSEDAQAGLDSAKADLDAAASQYGYANRASYLRALYGRTVNEKVYLKNLERAVWASDYYTASVEAISDAYTDEQLEAYYAEHTDELDSYDFDYAYIDGTAQPTVDDEGNTVDPTEAESEAALALAKAYAETMVSTLKGEVTVVDSDTDTDVNTDAGVQGQVKDFAALATELGSQAYTQVNNPGNTFSNAPFAEWLMDPARVDGDVDMFEVEGSGYYVVQFHSRYRSDTLSSADVRHILIATSHKDDPATEDVNESLMEFTEEDRIAAKAEAERIMNEFLSGEQTGERFGELAEQYSDDTRNDDGTLYTPGGLYEDVTPSTNFVQEFLDWIFTDGRKAGDVGIVQTTYGYHIMYLDTADEAQWIADSKDALVAEDQEALLENITANYEVSVNKWYQEPAAPVEESQEPQESDGAQAE